MSNSSKCFEVELNIGGRKLSIQTGKLAKQANGSVVVSYGESVVLVSVTCSREPKEDIDYFPLTVDFEEKLYAAGKIPGGFIKREGRPPEHAILSSRLIDRPIRPLFPDYFMNTVQIIAIPLSADRETPLDIQGMIGASAALCISDIPFECPVGSVRIGRIKGEFVINPTFSQLSESDLNLIMAGTADAITMVEAGAKSVSEKIFIEALELGYKYIKEVANVQLNLLEQTKKEKLQFTLPEIPSSLKEEITNFANDKMKFALSGKTKKEREDILFQLEKETIETFTQKYEEEYKNCKLLIREILFDMEKQIVREKITQGIRPDDRGNKDIRPISCEIGFLPRAHGSGLFTRGQTQVLSIVTLGAVGEEQRIDGLTDEASKRYMHQYNFPPFCTGETKPLRGPSRREIGHGALAERALVPMLPPEDIFPYTIRVVSEVLESNGSSSMASVCGSTIALMDAGVPISNAVAGIAMGLVKNDNSCYILSDIQGIEDSCGDMDFKVAGTKDGITALQMDIKIKGLTQEIMEKALEQAKEGRLHILEKMQETISTPKKSLSPYAPRVLIQQLEPDKIGTVIGTGGKTIKKIIEETCTKIDIEEDGKIYIYANNLESAEKAWQIIQGLIEEVEIGKTYTGEVKRITNFGAFLEVLPGKEGLLHISQISTKRIEKVEDVLKMGQKVTVRVKDIDEMDRINLTMKGVTQG